MATFWALSCLILCIAFAWTERNNRKRIIELWGELRYWRQTALDQGNRLKSADLLEGIGKLDGVHFNQRVNIFTGSRDSARNIADTLSAAGLGDITEGDNEGAYWFEVADGDVQYNVFYDGDAS